jgi:hypothetical protein
MYDAYQSIHVIAATRGGMAISLGAVQPSLTRPTWPYELLSVGPPSLLPD